MENREKNIEWWQEEYGFFGEHYLEGDNSQEGYLIKHKQTLEERTNTEVTGIVKLLKLNPEANILDIPCGYGRHSIDLAKLGYKIVASDLNTIHLAKAKNNAQLANVKIDFRKENMIDIKYNAEFDAVINMFYSFGFFEKDEDNLKVLKNFHNALKSNGKLLFHTDVNIPRIIAGKYRENETRKLISGGQLRIIDKYDPKTKRINGTWTIIRPDGSEARKNYSVRVYEKDEFIELCKSIGFKQFEAYSDWDGTSYTDDSEDMIIIAQK